MRRLGAAWALGFFVLLGGCGAKAPDHPEELRIIVQGFLASLELKNYPVATESVDPSRRADFVRYTDDLGDKTTITESQIRSIDVPTNEERDKLPDDAPLEATVVVSYKYFRLPSTTVKNEVKSMTWVFNSDRKRWFLKNGW
ncbi:MAG: hypothetical protein AB1405_03875 [Bdellovibrionota bacterium]